MERKQIVSVRYKSKYGDGYSERNYIYYSEIPLKVGQIINAPTKNGASEAKVSRVNVDESEIPAILRGCLKTITKDDLLLDAERMPQMDNQTTLEDFFR